MLFLVCMMRNCFVLFFANKTDRQKNSPKIVLEAVIFVCIRLQKSYNFKNHLWKGAVPLQKRIYLLQILFVFFSCMLLGKLAYEQLYRSALLTGVLTADSSWVIWLHRVMALLPR